MRKNQTVSYEYAKKLFDRFDGYFHHVWIDEEGQAWQREPGMRRPKNMKEELMWLPDAIVIPEDEDEDAYYEPIRDPVSFKEFCQYFGWRVKKHGRK